MGMVMENIAVLTDFFLQNIPQENKIIFTDKYESWNITVWKDQKDVTHAQVYSPENGQLNLILGEDGFTQKL